MIKKSEGGEIMSSYSELIKNFERVRSYMREFYVFGLKSRGGFNRKSGREYDDERRRIESWLGEHMSFSRTPEGKNVYISIDSRAIHHNPLYKAWKAKSFTDGDITLHFLIFDILHTPEIKLSIPEISKIIDEKYLCHFSEPFVYDESTLRKKLKEYEGEGIIVSEKTGKKNLYRRAESVDVAPLCDALDFFSEASPCGVVGSFLLDKIDSSELFTFKHHYITGAIDSGVMAALFSAMREGRAVSVDNLNHKREEPRRTHVLPLRIFISAQNGRQHLLAYQYSSKCFVALRLDYLSRVKLEGVEPRFAELREMLDDAETKMWGVNIKRGKFGDRLESVSFVVKINPGEEYIVKRLEREKRIGRVEQLDDLTYRFSAEVYDSWEMVPWIRTFISRIESMNFSNRTVENRFKEDIREMYRMYGIDGEVAE